MSEWSSKVHWGDWDNPTGNPVSPFLINQDEVEWQRDFECLDSWWQLPNGFQVPHDVCLEGIQVYSSWLVCFQLCKCFESYAQSPRNDDPNFCLRSIRAPKRPFFWRNRKLLNSDVKSWYAMKLLNTEIPVHHAMFFRAMLTTMRVCEDCMSILYFMGMSWNVSFENIMK